MALSFTRENPEPAPEAFAFIDGFADIDQLSEDLDREFGPDQWIEVTNDRADEVLATADQAATFVLISLSSDLPQSVAGTAKLIRKARDSGLLVLLVVGEISSRSMHQLMREGVTDFAPYPDPPGALADAVNRLRFARSNGGQASLPSPGSPQQRKSWVITCYGVAGGVGSSTLATNVAWELANLVRKEGRRVALLDFNFQYGSVATYLDVPRREAVYELVSEAANLDQTGLTQALSTYQDKLWVLTAPRDALPLDIVSPADVSAILNLARESFDFLVVDMPQALMNWSEQVYSASDDFYAVMEVDMRSAQNMFRFLRTLKAEDMQLDKLRFVLNRAPGMTDLSGKSRVKRVAESLGIDFHNMLPDGGKQVVSACDQGAPLSEVARSNPLRKEILKIAQRIMTEAASDRAAK